MTGTNEVSRNPVNPEVKWESLLICLLNELKEKYRPRIVCLFTIPRNTDAGSPIADLTENPNELRLMDFKNALRMLDHGALTRDGIHFNTQPGIQWINEAFQTRIEEMEAELRKWSTRWHEVDLPAGEVPCTSSLRKSSGTSGQWQTWCSPLPVLT